MNVKIESTWKSRLAPEFEKPYFSQLVQYIKNQYATTTIYPPGNRIFSAFDHTPFDRVKVVILGQDPYHEPGQANGLSFSVNDGIPLPASLQNIYKELHTDLNIPPSPSGNLERWAKQGVLLLNATLTVQAHHAGSHQDHGWETFTDAAIHHLAQERQHLVFILWGAYARAKGAHIPPGQHCILHSVHPSPLSAHRGFFGSKPFSKTNQYLQQTGQTPIRW
jgi:uracil-DNA glycosylase